MDKIKEILVEFMDWLSNKDDVFYAFDNPEKAIDEFLKEIEND